MQTIYPPQAYRTRSIYVQPNEMVALLVYIGRIIRIHCLMKLALFEGVHTRQVILRQFSYENPLLFIRPSKNRSEKNTNSFGIIKLK